MEFEIVDIMFLVKSVKFPSGHFNIHEFVQFCSYSTRAGHSSKLKHRLCRSNYERNFYFNRIPRLWNSLPFLDITLSPSISGIISCRTSILTTCVHTTICVHAPSVLNYQSKCILTLVCNILCLFYCFIWLLAYAFSPSAQSMYFTSLFFCSSPLTSTTCVVKHNNNNNNNNNNKYLVTFLPPQTPNPKPLHIFNYTKANFNDLCSFLLDFDFTICLQSHNIEFIWFTIRSLILEAIYIYIYIFIIICP